MKSDKPFETEYKRWRHVKYAYVVQVLDISHFTGEHGWFSTVRVKGTQRDPKKERSWPAAVFRKEFVPIGRKKKAKSAHERLRDGDDL